MRIESVGHRLDVIVPAPHEERNSYSDSSRIDRRTFGTQTARAYKRFSLRGLFCAFASQHPFLPIQVSLCHADSIASQRQHVGVNKWLEPPGRHCDEAPRSDDLR